MALDGETVDSDSAAVISVEQLEARADVIKTRVARWGNRRWNRKFSSGTVSSSDENRGSGNGPGCCVIENWTLAGKPRTSGIGGSDGVPGGLRDQMVESVILTVNRIL